MTDTNKTKIVNFTSKDESDKFFDWLCENRLIRESEWNNDESACRVSDDILERFQNENGRLRPSQIADGDSVYMIIKTADGNPSWSIYSKRLSLKEAQKEILDLFNRKFDECAQSWEEAVVLSDSLSNGAVPEFPDGTLAFGFDVSHYSIEKEDFK